LRPKAVVLAVAGLDPSGGAGLAADVKALAALGIYCAPVVAAITVQDTRGVKDVRPVKAELLRAQAETAVRDLGIRWAKVGVLYSAENFRVMAELAQEHGLKLVMDPVLRAGTGQPLVEGPEGLRALKERLLPLAFAITPNAREAELLSGVPVKSLKDAEEAARRLAELGPEVVVVKGGHLSGQKAVDLLYHEGHVHLFPRERLPADAHGSGCAFSSALAGYLALGREVPEAVRLAGELAWRAIRWPLQVGSGRPVADPMAVLAREAERFEVLAEVRKAVELLEAEPGLAFFAPEVGTQVAMATSRPEGPEDVAAVEGRLVKARGRLRAAGPVWFGASDHMARLVLAAMRYDPGKRAAMNLRYDPRLVEALKRMGLSVASFDRASEPPEVAAREGATLPWAVESTVRACGGRVPDVIYDLGGPGKEPMVRLLGRTATEVAERAVETVRMALREEV